MHAPGCPGTAPFPVRPGCLRILKPLAGDRLRPLSAALQSAPTPLLVVDADGRVGDANEALAAAVGADLVGADLVGRWLGDLSAFGDLAAAVAEVRHSGAPAAVPGAAAGVATPLGDGRVLVMLPIAARRAAPDEQAAAALRDSADHYRALVGSIDQGFCVIEVLYDADGRPADCRFVETNAAFEAQAGFGADGRTMREVAPDHEQRWFDLYGDVARTGTPVRFEDHAQALGRWFDVHATRLDGSDRVAVLFTDITARKQADAALQASETQYRFLTESLKQQVWTATPDGALDYVNRYVTGYFGRSAEAMIGAGWQDAVHPDDLPTVAERWGHALRTGEPYRTEFRLLRAADQSYRWHLGRADALVEDGHIVKWFGANVDIHEQAVAEAALREREARYRALFDSLDIGFFIAEVIVDDAGAAVDYRFVEANPGFTAQTGRADVVGMRVREAIPGIEDKWIELFGRVAETGQPARVIDDAESIGGGWFNVYAARVGGRDTRLVAVLFYDVSEQRRLLAERDVALERLGQSEERHRLALEGGAMGTWEWHIPEDRLEGDERVYGLWGERPGAVESVAAFYARLVHPDDLAGLQAEVARTLASAEDYGSEFRIVTAGGHVRWVANRGRIVRDPAGVPMRMFGLSYDVTERREAEETMRRKNAEMEQFAYTISHDLKSPLVTITGFLGLLKGQLAAGRPERAAESADRVLGAAGRMGRLIDDLLQLSRAGRVTGDPATVDLDALVGGLADAFGPRVRAAGGTLEVQAPLGHVSADGRRLAEVVENLLANAVTYGLGGGGTRIAVHAERPSGRGLRLVVEDDGPGVPEAYRDKVFELFQQLDTGGNGTGVGLALVARIMEVLGGRAWAESAGGPAGREGARFVLEFPAAAVLGGLPATAPDAPTRSTDGRPPLLP